MTKYEVVNRPIEMLSINGMNAVVYDSLSVGQTTAFLGRTINGLPYIYEIDFNCYAADGQCAQPPFWRKMLESFEPVPEQ